MRYDEDRLYGLEIKLPEIKLPEIKLPEIKIPEFKLPEIKTYDVTLERGMSGHEILMKYGPLGHQTYTSMTPLMRDGILTAAAGYREIASKFQTHQ